MGFEVLECLCAIVRLYKFTDSRYTLVHGTSTQIYGFTLYASSRESINAKKIMKLLGGCK